ncbi:hypothetical protein BDP81DRAFT_441005, partial [Colletotrichum phormii]
MSRGSKQGGTAVLAALVYPGLSLSLCPRIRSALNFFLLRVFVAFFFSLSKGDFRS